MYSLPIDMLLPAVSFLVALPRPEVSEGLMNYSVCAIRFEVYTALQNHIVIFQVDTVL